MSAILHAAPAGYSTVSPYLIVEGADRLIDFMKQVCEAREIQRLLLPDSTIMHAEVRLGDSVIMLGEAGGEWQPMPAGLHVFVADADACYQRALQAGAASVSEPADQLHGDRMAGVKDPFGNVWWFATRLESLSSEELQRRVAGSRQQAAG